MPVDSLPCHRAAAYAVFFLSGAAALIYEVSWSRQVGAIVGHTSASAALVLAAYFTGLAIGQAVGGRLAARNPPLFGYAVAELLAAGWACLVPALLAWVDTAVVAETMEGIWLGAVTRHVFCFAVLLPTTIALGATLPLMAEHLSPRWSDRSRQIAIGYALNTAGGLVGVIAATAVLAPLGVRASGYYAAALSAACGVAACVLAAVCVRVPAPAMSATVLSAGQYSRPTRARNAARGWILIAAFSGFGTLGVEVLYTRMFSLVFHNSTYTFGAVLAVFLAGLGLGSVVAAALGRLVRPWLLATAGCSLGGIAVSASAVLFVRLTGLEYFTAGESFAAYLAAVFALTAAVVLVPATLLGLVLPAAFLAIGSRGGRATGGLAAANTIAAAVGAVSAEFLWTARFGLWGAIGLFCLVSGLTGAALLLRSRHRIAAGGLAAATIAAVAAVAANPDQALMWTTRRGETIVRRWESDYGWIDVVRSSKDSSLKVRQNLHYRHGSTGSNATREYRQGRLPLLLHPEPSDVAFLGLGTGLTAAPAVADEDVRRTVIVELIPEVVEAARLLGDANLGLVDHPKVDIRIDDAGHYLRRTDQRFDIIVSDLFVPWESRTGYLYTVEHYAAARRRLKPGGLFCQWIALYQVGPDEFELIADSFASVFPETTLWWGHLDPRFGIVALIGGDRPLDADPIRLAARWDALGTLPSGADPLLDSPSDLPGLYLGRWPAHCGRRLNTDEHPWVEFTAPISHRADRTLEGRALRSYFDNVLAELATGEIRFEATAESAAANPERRRALQRLILFGSADSGSEASVRTRSSEAVR